MKKSSITAFFKSDVQEEFSIKNPLIKLFASVYLKKRQATYIADLRKALG